MAISDTVQVDLIHNELNETNDLHRTSQAHVMPSPSSVPASREGSGGGGGKEASTEGALLACRLFAR